MSHVVEAGAVVEAVHEGGRAEEDAAGLQHPERLARGEMRREQVLVHGEREIEIEARVRDREIVGIGQHVRSDAAPVYVGADVTEAARREVALAEALAAADLEDPALPAFGAGRGGQVRIEVVGQVRCVERSARHERQRIDLVPRLVPGQIEAQALGRAL